MLNKEKISIVTGSSRGIGYAIKSLFEKKGIRVIGISKHGTNKGDLKCDVTNENQVIKLFEYIKNKYGKLDILINNAGIVKKTKFTNISLREWNEVLSVNLAGVFLCTREALKIMQKQQNGKIVNISSIAGRFRSISAGIHYTCSKYAVIGLTKQLAFEYAPYNININCVCPSQTRTDMIKKLSKNKINEIIMNIPMHRLAEPKEIAEVVFFLVSESSSYINGAAIDVNGAQF